MMKVIVVFKRLLASGNDHQMGLTAGIFLASILLKEMRYLVYIRYLCSVCISGHSHGPLHYTQFASHSHESLLHQQVMLGIVEELVHEYQ
jgi:hypothetical protein